jgi:starch synthase
MTGGKGPAAPAPGSPRFAIRYIADGFTTDGKIMGRQSAGKSLIRGMARRWKTDTLYGWGGPLDAPAAMEAQVRADGFAGKVVWCDRAGGLSSSALDAIYVPAPLTAEVSALRDRTDGATSLFGVTHTLSSHTAMDQLASLVMPPFRAWDGLICTSAAALGVVEWLHDEARAWWRDAAGVTRFNTPALTVVPLGVNVDDFVIPAAEKAAARARFGLSPDDVAFLFAGRMTFHAKANPVALYAGLEAASAMLGKQLVCIEAGIAPNASILDGFARARATIAPSVRFLPVDGADSAAYRAAWAAADVFTSLSDNIQETFGITPLEAMAAGLPVLATDWDGYRDTVRDGVDGILAPTLAPAPGDGARLARRYGEGGLNYDRYIGMASMETIVDVDAVAAAIARLASDPALRARMGAAGAERARTHYDWPVLLDRYAAFAADLAQRRRAAAGSRRAPPARPDPFALFAHYPTRTLCDADPITMRVADPAALERLLGLSALNYVVGADHVAAEAIMAVHRAARDASRLGDLVGPASGLPRETAIAAATWLAKAGVLRIG